MSSRGSDARTRLGVYLLEDSGRPQSPATLPPHVLTALRGLRPYLTRLVVGSRRPLAADDVARLREIADDVRVDASASYLTLLSKLDPTTYDEVLLTGSGWLGPVADLGPVFDRMAGAAPWSLLPAGSGRPYERQFALVPDPGWWVLPGDAAAAMGATGRVAVAGTRFAFPAENYPSADPALMNLPQLIADGLPFVPIASLGVDPLVADRLAVVPADGFTALLGTGIDRAEVWQGLLDAVPLRVLTTNLGLTRVLGTTPTASTTLRTVAVLHLYYPDLTDELMDRVDLLPGEVDVVVTTSDDRKKSQIEGSLAARTVQHRAEVRVVDSNRGRDISAFLVGCADVLGDPSYDVVVKLHGKRSAQDDVNASSWFRRHLFDNLLPSVEAASELYAWFAEDPQLGMVVPPVIHQHYPTMGHAWLGNRRLAESLADRLGLGVPLDEDTPVAPYGSMFVARREALLPWLDLGLRWEDFPDEGAYVDGTLAHAVERMFCYVAAGTGRYTGTVLGAGLGGLEYGFLEYKLQAVSARMPAFAVDQVPYLERASATWRQALARRMPGLAERVKPLYRRLRYGRSTRH